MEVGNKGQFGNLTGLAMSIVVLVVVVSAGALILANFASNPVVTADPNATATVMAGQTGLSQLIGWVPLLIIIIIAVIILGYFGLRMSQGGGRA